MPGFLEGKRVLVLGGWGLVGAAVCRELLAHGAAELGVHSLRASEAEEATRDLTRRFPDCATRLLPLSGDLFLPVDLKDAPREQALADPAIRERLLDAIYSELTPAILEGSTLYRLVHDLRPHLIVDSVNTATALAYEDVYRLVRRVRRLLEADDSPSGALADAVREQLGALQLPRLIRHVQILFEAMLRSGTELYLKIGTTGTGGMGLNVPYTHSEERPSRLLLSKSGVAGAHSMLLFLMGATPGGPSVKEIKPAAAVAWKRIAKGPVLRGGRPIPLYDCPPRGARPAAEAIRPDLGAPPWRALDGAVLEAAYVDTGENGYFSREEFETVTELGQMEFVTPEEIARHVVAEIRGAGTGKDVVSAMAGAVLGPTYRAGVLRGSALETLAELDSPDEPSIAFEMLGPPRLSKLLYEAHLLERACGSPEALCDREPDEVSRGLADLVLGDSRLRARIVSIGIGILLPDGRLLRGPVLKTPADAEEAGGAPSGPELDRWARAGWVDLRPSNVSLWRERVRRIVADSRAGESAAAGTAARRTAASWAAERPYSPGRLAAWILANEDGGERSL